MGHLMHDTRVQYAARAGPPLRFAARRLYERCGYRERARRAMVKEKWQHPGMEWVLLVK